MNLVVLGEQEALIPLHASAVLLPLRGEDEPQSGAPLHRELVAVLRLVGEVEHEHQPLLGAAPFHGVDAPLLLVAVQPPEALLSVILLPQGGVVEVQVV